MVSRFLRLATLVIAAATIASPARADDRRDDTWSALWAVRLAAPHIVGVRASFTDVQSGSSDLGLGLWMHGTGYHEGDLNFRSATGIRLVQTNGIEGGLSSDLAIGRRFDVTDDGGVFIRGGARGFIEANNLVQTSMLEVPQVQLGYQITNEGGKTFTSSRRRRSRDWRMTETPYLFELAGRGSIGLAARYEIGADKRDFRPAPAGGGHVAIGFGPLHVEGSFTRLAPTGAVRAPFDVLEVNGCFVVSELALCGDARYLVTSLATAAGPPEAQTIIYAGFTLGLAPFGARLGGTF
ncbi:MAG: hypothetical protein KF819_07385 [Labilithrix sp.]|nr:hypothetical protein [Labilithrix sp.]